MTLDVLKLLNLMTLLVEVQVSKFYSLSMCASVVLEVPNNVSCCSSGLYDRYIEENDKLVCNFNAATLVAGSSCLMSVKPAGIESYFLN